MTAPFITVAPGPRNAWKSEDDLRFYRWQGRDLPSVTTLRRMAGLPLLLHQWAISEVVNRAVDSNGDLNRMLTSDDPAVIKAVKSWLRAATTEKRDLAAGLGTRVHDAAAQGRTLGQVEADVAPFLRQYYDWLDVMGAKILATEKQVFNLTVGYAGTFDLLAKFPDTSRYIVDIKTGKSTYAEHALQGYAYAMAEFVGEDDVVDVALTKSLQQAAGVALLHLRPEGWTWQVLKLEEETWIAFTGLLDFAMWAHRHPTIADLLLDERSGAA